MANLGFLISLSQEKYSRHGEYVHHHTYPKINKNMKKILLIDDREDNLITTEAVLKTYLPNCVVLKALSGQEGINIAKNEQPDTILLDIIMPQMDGYEVCKRLKEDELTKCIPVIMITAIKTYSDNRVRGLNIGADVFLSKPIDPVELTAHINVMLRIKGAEDKLRAEKYVLGKMVNEKTKELLIANEKLKQYISRHKVAEDALRESEENLTSIFNNMVDVYYKLDKNGKILAVSPSALKLYKCDNINEIVGKQASDFVYDPKENELLIEELKKNGCVKNYQIRHKQKDGNRIFVETNTTALFDDSGNFTGVVGVFRDITERMKGEGELRKLSTAVKQSPSVIAITDLKGNLEYVNPKFSELTGYSFEEAIGQNTRILKSGKQPNELYKELWKTISSGNEWRGELHNKKKNGEFFWEAASISPIFDEQGRKTNYIKVAEDITHRKRAEQIQKVLYNISNAVITTDNLEKLIGRIQQELGTIIDTTNFYIALYDRKTDTLSLPYYSDEKDKFTSVPAGKTLTKYVIETKKPLLANIELKKRFVDEGLLEYVGSLSKIWLGAPLKIEGQVTGVLAVQSYTDENAYDGSDMEMLEFVSDQVSISIDRKKAEQDLIATFKRAEESDRLKTVFLQNISHEIRTPMSGILGFIDLLSEPELSGEKQKEYVDVIKISSDRMLSTVNDLIDISIIESGQAKVFNAETNINQQTENLFACFKQKAANKGIKFLIKNTLPEPEANIVTDSDKFYSILSYLVKNAIKFTSEGYVEFGYNLKSDRGVAELEFFVKDTGVGIPKDRQQAIFDRFVQADLNLARRFEGAGLGLSISKAYVEMLGGKIWVESEEGAGSQFYFTIPYKYKPKEITTDKNEIFRTEPPHQARELKILIAEDEETADKHLTIILKNLSREILHTVTGTGAVELCRKNPDIDLILMDIKLQEMNGHEAVRQIRKFNKEVVIIAETAYALSGDRKKALDAGCDDYIAKPIMRGVLLTKIKELMENKR